MRILSLVPSITETLMDLNPATVVGRTKFCIHPKNELEKLAVVGGTKNLHIEKIYELKPDLIIANREENEKDQIEELMKDFNVWLTNVENLDDNYDLILKIGETVDRLEMAEQICLKTKNIFENYQLKKKVKIAYLIWRKPYMTVGGDNFVNHIIEKWGFENIFKEKLRYPEIELSELEDAEAILLSTEPYPFSEKHLDEFQSVWPDKRIVIVDGEAFAWYGSRLSKLEDFYKKLIQNFSER